MSTIKSSLNIANKTLKWFILLSISFYSSTVFSEADFSAENERLGLKSAVRIAIENDPWLQGNLYSQNAVEASSISAGTLPDPKVSVGYLNLPTDTFDIQQEAMTQLKVGVSQSFPRGDSLELKRKQLELVGSQHPYQRMDRKAKLTVTVGQLWLDAYKAQESIALIEKNRFLFEQLADIAEARYSAALGQTRQHDIIRAQLEMTRLEDRLTMLNQQKDMFQEKLAEWLGDSFLTEELADAATAGSFSASKIKLDTELPDLKMNQPQLYVTRSTTSQQLLAEILTRHPSVKVFDKKIEVARTGVDLANQKYKPAWAVNASYAYRDDDLQGNDRADLFSIGVTFDLPIFTAKRQDKEVQAATYQTESVKTEKLLLLRNLMAGFESAKAQLTRLKERQKLYQSQLLPQMYDQAEASLTAYTNDDGDFAEVVRARIAELNAEIDALSINVEVQKLVLQLNYLVLSDGAPDEVISKWKSSSTGGE